jgi:hypothetical protein
MTEGLARKLPKLPARREHRDVTVSFKVSERERAMLAEEASRVGITVSQVIRWRCGWSA